MRKRVDVTIPELLHVYCYVLRERPWAMYFNADAKENNIIYIY